MTLDIIEAAAMALCKSHLHKGWALASDEQRALYRELAGSVIVFVVPLIEARTLERAAKWLDDEATACLSNIIEDDDINPPALRARATALIEASSHIRALKEQP